MAVQSIKKIFNLKGQVVYTKKDFSLPNPRGFTTLFSLRVYLIRMRTQEKREVQKFLILK